MKKKKGKVNRLLLYFAQEHIQLPMHKRFVLLKAYMSVYRLSGRLLVYPSSVIYIPTNREEEMPFVVSAYPKTNMTTEIVRYVQKLKRFDFEKIPKFSPTAFRWGIWWREIPTIGKNEWIELDIRRAYPRTLYMVGAINSLDWKRAVLSKPISTSINISLGVMQAYHIDATFEDGKIQSFFEGRKSDAYNRLAGYFLYLTNPINVFPIARYIDAFIVHRSTIEEFKEELKKVGYTAVEKGIIKEVEKNGPIVRFHIQEFDGEDKIWTFGSGAKLH
jgi:hypothetical protein